MADEPREHLTLIAESVEISAGSVLRAVVGEEVTDVDRMVWLDAIAIDNDHTDQRVHVRLFLKDERALEIAITMIQAIGRAQGKGQRE